VCDELGQLCTRREYEKERAAHDRLVHLDAALDNPRSIVPAVTTATHLERPSVHPNADRQLVVGGGAGGTDDVESETVPARNSPVRRGVRDRAENEHSLSEAEATCLSRGRAAMLGGARRRVESEDVLAHLVTVVVRADARAL